MQACDPKQRKVMVRVNPGDDGFPTLITLLHFVGVARGNDVPIGNHFIACNRDSASAGNRGTVGAPKNLNSEH